LAQNKIKSKGNTAKEKKEPGFMAIKIIGILFVVLIVGVAALGKMSGADKISRGTLTQGESCTTNEECSAGFLCYSYQNTSFMCHKKCKDNSNCPSGTKCKTVVKNARRKIRTAHLCISDADL